MSAITRYYITDRKSAREPLLDSIERNVAEGVEYIQIREKDLTARELYELTRAAVAIAGSRTKILVNDRGDVALAAGAHGVHLRSGSVSPIVIKHIIPLVAVSCHTVEEVQAAAGADLIVFGPIFETPGKGPAIGLDELERAVRVSPAPILALGGIKASNAAHCCARGASGVAGIRLFQR